MKNLRQLLIGLLTAIGSSILVLAAGSLALLEGAISPALPVTLSTAAPSLTASPFITSTPIISTLTGPTLAVTPTLTFTATATQTEVFACQKTPPGWVPYVVKAGDTLQSLAEQSGQTSDVILNANCLISPVLLEGTILYLPFSGQTATVTPALPTPLPTVQVIYPTVIAPIKTAPPSCGRPYGWVAYIVKPGDNLYRLSLAFGVTQYQLQVANCLSSTFIYAGQVLYVPNIPTRTPMITNTATQMPSATFTATKTTPPPPATATATTPAPSATPAPATATATASETATQTPSATSTATLTPEPTSGTTAPAALP